MLFAVGDCLEYVPEFEHSIHAYIMRFYYVGFFLNLGRQSKDMFCSPFLIFLHVFSNEVTSLSRKLCAIQFNRVLHFS